ncbi:MAG TPA: hypothetical protein VNO30_16595 [Kofleriaceae bacterium]|nr:hypothetical protein [Kofleriaceae bacterium]
MNIALDTLTFGRLLDIALLGACPSPSEIRAILQIAQLAAGVDPTDDTDEHRLLGAVTYRLCTLAQIPISSVPVLSPLPIDAEERSALISSLAGRVVTTGGRELAFIVAYLLIVSDLELSPVESELLEGLQRALWIDQDRADELLLEASELVTPGARSELGSAAAQL